MDSSVIPNQFGNSQGAAHLAAVVNEFLRSSFFAKTPAKFEFRHRQPAESQQIRFLIGSQRAAHFVDDAEHAQGSIVRRHERSTGIETIPRPRHNERMRRETLVLSRVRNDEQPALHNGVGTESELARR